MNISFSHPHSREERWSSCCKGLGCTVFGRQALEERRTLTGRRGPRSSSFVPLALYKLNACPGLAWELCCPKKLSSVSDNGSNSSKGGPVMSKSEDQKHQALHRFSRASLADSPSLAHVRANTENDGKSCALFQGGNASRKNRAFESGPFAFGQQHCCLLTRVQRHNRKLSGLRFPSLFNETNNSYIGGVFHGHTSSFAL